MRASTAVTILAGWHTRRKTAVAGYQDIAEGTAAGRGSQRVELRV